MRIRFERTGGFANMPLRLDVDTERVAPSVASDLLAAVADSGILKLAEQTSANPRGNAADLFVYRISLVDGERVGSWVFDDVTVPRELRPLLTYLQKLAKPEFKGQPE